MVSQGIEAKLDGQERNNSIYRLKFQNGGGNKTTAFDDKSRAVK